MLAAPLLSPATALAQASKDKPTPATAMEVNAYGVMSIATFCEARAQKIDFNKSLAVAGVGLLSLEDWARAIAGDSKGAASTRAAAANELRITLGPGSIKFFRTYRPCQSWPELRRGC